MNKKLVCSVCGINIKKRTSNGLRFCSVHYRENEKNRRLKYKDKIRSLLKIWRNKNRDKIKILNKKYVDSGYVNNWKKINRKSVLESERKYVENNREKKNIRNRNRAKRIKELIGSHSKKEWSNLKKKFNFKCSLCGKKKKLTKDHIIPIWEPNSTNDILNIRPLCRSCNSSEGAKYQHRKRSELKINNLTK